MIGCFGSSEAFKQCLEWWVWWKCLLVPGAAAKYSTSTHTTDPALWCEEILFQAAIIKFFFFKEWLEALKIFGIGKEEGQRILGRLGRALLDEHEKLFGSYWRQTLGPSSSMQQLLGKGISVRTSRPPQGG